MINVEKFCKKYNGKSVEDDVYRMSDDATGFARQYRSALKKDLVDAGATLEKFSIGYYDVYGFAGKDGKLVYFSADIPRYGIPFNPASLAITEMFMARKANDLKDVSGKGGPNEWSTFSGSADLIVKILER